MARPNSETVTTFGEVLHSANNAHSRVNVKPRALDN